MPLPGYRYLGKDRGERYLTPEGQEISKRQYRNLVLKREIGITLSEREYETQKWAGKRSSKAAVRQKQRGSAIRDYASQRGIPEEEAAKEASRWDSAFSRAESEVVSMRKRGEEDRTPDGPLSRFLVSLGRRRPDATYDVGDTP